MNDSYYIKENGQQTGPFTLQEMFQQNLDVDTMILTPGSNEWQEASYVGEFFEYFEAQGIYLPTEGNLAGFGIRLLAFIIDWVLCGIAFFSAMPEFANQLATTFNKNRLENANTLEMQKINLLLLVTFALYNALLESTPMRGSIGKKLCRLAVVDADGHRLHVGRALIRNLTQIAWHFTLFAGFLTMLWSDRKQCWHDMLAKTYVIRREA